MLVMLWLRCLRAIDPIDEGVKPEWMLVDGSSLRIGRRGRKLRMLSHADPLLGDAAADRLQHGGRLRILTPNGFDDTWDLPAARWRKTKTGCRLRHTNRCGS